MWLFTKEGMFSISRWDNQIQFRAFVRADLERLAKRYGLEEYAIVETPERDYGYRIMLQPKVAERVVSQMVSDINYTNFKPEAGKICGKKRYQLYLQIHYDLKFALETDN